jgi:drug/metabolite transporter (DMT)-like permease
LFTAAAPAVTTLVAIPLLREVPSLVAVIGVCVASLGMLVGLSRGRAKAG